MSTSAPSGTAAATSEVSTETCEPWATRATGIPNREALGIGTLMNARGLMELIIINIGLQRGIISEGLFATLVIMAVVTTLMASPIFDRLVGTGPNAIQPEPDADPLEGERRPTS
jgi:Kef-type K+ transport system membrane component KefB